MSCETCKIKKHLSVVERMNFVKMIYYVKSKFSNDLYGKLIEYINSHSRITELWGKKQLNIVQRFIMVIR
jgi:hypothetical protein